MSQFARPNRTKTMFATIDANRPTYARQKLGGIESSQNVVKSGTAAQGAENTNVQAQTQNVKDTTRNDYQTGTAFVAAGKRVADQGAFVNQAGPAFQSQFAGNPTGAASLQTNADGTQTVLNAQQAVVTEGANQGAAAGSAVNTGLLNKFTNDGTALTGMTTAPATDELNAAYNADVNKLDVAGKQLTEGNLGQLADTSAFEDQQLQLSSVLADRQSNIGKLQALYGVGYDSDKYGALDSNILQGQFNDAATAATENLAARDSTIKAGDKIREQYGKQVADSRKITGEAKAVADKELGRLGGELSRLDEAIAARIVTEGDNKTTATKALEAQRDKIKKDYADKEKLLQASAKTNNEKVAADAEFKAKADAEHKKKKDLSAQLRNKYGIEINPINAAKEEMKYWEDLYKRAEKGDVKAIAEMSTLGAARGARKAAEVAKGLGKAAKDTGKKAVAAAKNAPAKAKEYVAEKTKNVFNPSKWGRK